MIFQSAFAAMLVLVAALRPHGAMTQLMSTCAERSPERQGELGCTVLEDKLMPAGLTGPLLWHIDRFATLERARVAVSATSIAMEAGGIAWLMTLEASASNHHGGTHVTHVGPLPLPKADRYSMLVQSARFAPGMYSLPHHHSGVEAVYVVEGEGCYETPGRGFAVRTGDTLALPAGTQMRAGVTGSARRHVLAVIVHDAAQPATMRMEEGAGPPLATCK